MAKHNFTDGYQAPKARHDQVELVEKFFKKDQTISTKIEERSEVKQQQFTASEIISGEERKKEALQRREEFLKQNEDLYLTVKTSSEFKTVPVKSRKELEEEREAYIKKTVLRIQEEAFALSMRAKEEEEKRVEMLRLEKQRIIKEDQMRQEAMLRAEEERRQRDLARQDELRRQEQLLNNQKAENERLRIEKLKRDQEEREKLEKLRKEEEKRRAEVERKEMLKRQEESRHLEEMKHMEELKYQERRQIEAIIERGRIHFFTCPFSIISNFISR